jgi:hypothetical protein
MNQNAGTHNSVIEIGRIPISLSTDNAAFHDLLRQRYRGFLSTAHPEFELEFRLAENGSVSDEDVRVWHEGADWRIERGDFRARWNPQTGRGSVEQNASPYAPDSVLRIVHSLVLASRGGFLLHSASAICEGRACLFSGVSGAGKTTITRLAPPDVTLLTDEISYVRPDASGYEAFGTPFAGDLAKPGENCAAEVSALFFLEQGVANRIEELPPAEALRRLLRNILFFADDSCLIAKLLTTACDFVTRVPSRLLTFYPDSKVWDTIRDFQREPAHV